MFNLSRKEYHIGKQCLSLTLEGRHTCLFCSSLQALEDNLEMFQYGGKWGCVESRLYRCKGFLGIAHSLSLNVVIVNQGSLTGSNGDAAAEPDSSLWYSGERQVGRAWCQDKGSGNKIKAQLLGLRDKVRPWF